MGLHIFPDRPTVQPMESKSAEWPDEAQGLRLLRSFLALPPEKRQLVLEFVEQLCGEQAPEAKGSSEAAPP
jgi:hypothetical protein